MVHKEVGIYIDYTNTTVAVALAFMDINKNVYVAGNPDGVPEGFVIKWR